MGFVALVAGVLLIALAGKRASRGAYIAIGIGAILASIWEYQQ
jgi:hypothetical protein